MHVCYATPRTETAWCRTWQERHRRCGLESSPFNCAKACWSDGTLFTVKDILFAVESETALRDELPSWLANGSISGEVQTVPLATPLEFEGQTFAFDPWTIRVVFNQPNGFFYDNLSSIPIYLPEHYLRQFHPTLGDSELIKAKIEAVGAAADAILQIAESSQ